MVPTLTLSVVFKQSYLLKHNVERCVRDIGNNVGIILFHERFHRNDAAIKRDDTVL